MPRGWVRVDMLDDEMDFVYKTTRTNIGERTVNMVFCIPGGIWTNRVLDHICVVFDKTWAMEYAGRADGKMSGGTLCRFDPRGTKVVHTRYDKGPLPHTPPVGVPPKQWDYFVAWHSFHCSFVVQHRRWSKIVAFPFL